MVAVVIVVRMIIEIVMWVSLLLCNASDGALLLDNMWNYSNVSKVMFQTLFINMVMEKKIRRNS